MRLRRHRRARPAHGAGAAARRRCARARRRGAAARGRADLGARAVPIVDRTGQPLALSYEAVTVGVWPSRIPDRRAFAQALSHVHARHAGRRSSSAWAGARSTSSRCAASRRRRGRASRRTATLGPLVKSRAIEPQQEPRRIYPNGGLAAQVVGVDGDGLSGVELSRNDVLSARDGLALGLEGQRPARRATRTGRACCTCASPCRARTCSSRSTCASSGSCSRRSPRPAAKWHAKAVTAVVLDTRTGGILAMAAAPGVPPAGYRAGNPDGVAPARHHRSLRARLDVQARDVHGRAAGGRDHAQHAVRRARTPTRKTFETTARTIQDAHSARGIEHWTAREILAHSSNVGTITIAEQKLGQTRLQQVDPPRRHRQAAPASTCRASGKGVLLRRRQVVRHRDPQRPDRRGHRGHAAADGGALRLGRERRQVDPAARHRGHRRQADHRTGRSASS